jgi:hypothetical protein
MIAFLGAIAALRWQVISSQPEPSGLDGGNWLALGHTLLGSHSRSASIMYPPLVPLLMVGMSAIWGALTSAQILALASGLAPAAGAYVLLRRRLGFRAVLVSALLAPAASTGEAAAWGGYPQLFALGLMPIVLWATDLFLTTGYFRWAWVTSAILALTLSTSDLIGVATIVCAALAVIARTLGSAERERYSVKVAAKALLIVTVPSLALAPIYVTLVRGVLENTATRHSNQYITLANLAPNLANIFKDNVAFWFLLACIALVSPVLLFARSERPFASAAVAILAFIGAAVLLTGQVRVLYLLPLAIAAGVGAWWQKLSDSNHLIAVTLDRVMIAIMCLVLVVQSALGIATFDQQVRWYSALDPGVVAGLQQLNHIAPRTAVLAVGPAANPTNQPGWPMGWWVEGLLDRPTYYASDPEWLNTADERRRADVANAMFIPSEGLGGALSIARVRGISYIVVATGWSGYRSWVAHDNGMKGAAVVIDNESLLVISVGA